MTKVRMNDKLLALRLFVRVVRTGSFSAAARELDLSQPSVSRIIAALEKDVGAALVTRTTRAVTLTDAGEDYLARVEAILASLEEADHVARGRWNCAASLRIALPASFGVREIVPVMPGFLAPPSCPARQPVGERSAAGRDQGWCRRRAPPRRDWPTQRHGSADRADAAADRGVAGVPARARHARARPRAWPAHAAIVGPAGTSAGHGPSKGTADACRSA